MATIEELSAALVKADAAGNTADAKAFADAIRQMRSSEMAAPTAPAQPETGIPGPRKPGFLETLATRPLEVLEVPLAVGANIATGLPVYLSGALGPEAQRTVARNIQYQPRGEMAQAALESLGRGAEALKIPPYMGTIGTGMATRVPTRTETRAGVAKVVGPSEAKIAKMTAEDYARGPQIDAAADAQRMGILLRPTDIQPTAMPRITETVAGRKGADLVVEANKAQVRKVQLADMGLPETAPLNKAATFDQARKNVSKPYDEVAKLPVMTADENTISQLQSIRKTQDLIGTKEYAAAIDDLVDSALAQTQKGMSGASLKDSISVLRADAKKTYNSTSATLADQHVADARLAVANALESMIESNISNPKLLDQFRDARQKMARIYAYEGATDLNTGLLDINKLARITAKDNNLTGDIAALGRVAGNFPHAFETKPKRSWAKGAAVELGRSTPPGALGGLAGFQLTGDYTGAIIGSLAGALGGKVAQKYAAGRVASPEYQAGLTLRDLRSPVANQLAAQQAPIPQERALVPYQAPVEVLGPGEGPYQPNFVFAQQPGQPRVTPVMPETNRLLGAPSPEATINALRAEDVRRAGVSRALGQEAEARAAAAEAAARRPAAGEVILELDPVTGRLREASQGIKGATPETFSNFGAALQTAADKVTSGKRFDLTAAEKVAWDKTRVDLAEVAPGFKTLNDKAIAEKMLDRAWVQETAAKAREKAAAFDQLAARAKDERARQAALANRERMMDLAEQMEDTLRGPRPDVSGKQQGPKTRAAIRNRLIGGENQNALTR